MEPNARFGLDGSRARRVACHSPSAVNDRTLRAPARESTKVLRQASASGTVDRLVISGRMADVCAELDRMVAREATLGAY